MLLSIEGDTGTWKTAFALTSPTPLVCFSFDIGSELAVNGTAYDKFFKDLTVQTIKYNRLDASKNKIDKEETFALWRAADITIYELPQPIQLDSSTVTGYIQLWEYFIQLFGLAASDDHISTIVVDTATIARGIKVNAYLEELNKREGETKRKQLLQIEYGHPNSAIENLYSIMAVVGKNFVTTHHIREVYQDQIVRGQKESVPTGRMELEGWNKTHRFVDVAVVMEKDDKLHEVRAKYIKCRPNPKFEGTYVLGDPCWNNLVDHISGSLAGRIKFQRQEK